MDDVKIRKAVVEDCDKLMQLMEELAEYEKESHLMQLSPEDLRRDGFGDNPSFGCMVAEVSLSGSCGVHTKDRTNTTIVGYALYYDNYSAKVGKVLYMEDLYLQPNYRRRGIGQRLFRAVAKEAKERGCYRFRWGCLGWNSSAMEFYKKQNPIEDTIDHRTFHIDQPDLTKLSI